MKNHRIHITSRLCHIFLLWVVTASAGLQQKDIGMGFTAHKEEDCGTCQGFWDPGLALAVFSCGEMFGNHIGSEKGSGFFMG